MIDSGAQCCVCVRRTRLQRLSSSPNNTFLIGPPLTRYTLHQLDVEASECEFHEFLKSASFDPDLETAETLVDKDMAERWNEKLPVQNLADEVASERKKRELRRNTGGKIKEA